MSGQHCKEQRDDATQKSGHRIFKETVKIHGVKTPIAKKIASDFYKTVKDRPKEKIFKLCEELWKSGYIEESFIACHWSYALRKKYKPEDFVVFEKWVELYVTNWAYCDTLCNHTMGTFIEMYPQYLTKLKEWGKI